MSDKPLAGNDTIVFILLWLTICNSIFLLALLWRTQK